jgi:hypothetical protein
LSEAISPIRQQGKKKLRLNAEANNIDSQAEKQTDGRDCINLFSKLIEIGRRISDF